MSDQPDAGATSETAQTRKTIHTIHTNKANMEWWLRRSNDIRGPCGPKVSWHLSDRWEKTPKKPHPGNLAWPGIEPGPAAWQARRLPLAPQRWTVIVIITYFVITIIVIVLIIVMITIITIFNIIVVRIERETSAACSCCWRQQRTRKFSNRQEKFRNPHWSKEKHRCRSKFRKY